MTHPDVAKWLRALPARDGFAPGFAKTEHSAAATRERALASTIIAIRDELEDLQEEHDAVGLEELNQKLGAYQREARNLLEQRRKVRGIRAEILRHVESKIRDLDTEDAQLPRSRN